MVLAYYKLREIVPLELAIEERKLIQLTLLWRVFGNFDSLPTPTVIRIGDSHGLVDGNHRGVWFSLNNIPEIIAEYKRAEQLVTDVVGKRGFAKFDTSVYIDNFKSVARTNLDKGIRSIVDFARTVRNPERYTMNGPIPLPDGMSYSEFKRFILRPGFRETIDPSDTKWEQLAY